MQSMQYVTKEYSEDTRLKNETLFHTASGRLGVRGCFEEGAPEGTPSIRGAYLNGFCETEPIVYNEKLYGFPEEKQVIVNLPDAQTIKLCAEGEDIVCWRGEELIRVLDMEKGVYERSFFFSTAHGRLKISFTRLVSFALRELYAVECRIESLDFAGKIQVSSELDADVKNFTSTADPRVASGSGIMLRKVAMNITNDVMTAEMETIRSHRHVLCAVVHDIEGSITQTTPDKSVLTTSLTLSAGEVAVFHKYCIYHELLDDGEAAEVVSNLCRYAGEGYESLRTRQKEYLDRFWKHVRVEVEGDDKLQNQLDFCLYGMLASTGQDGTRSVAAKGLSGEGYEGHYFWDSEIYVFPFFLLSEPEIALGLLKYRYLHLDDARAHARRLGHSTGALYPWRTITGSECSSHYPSGSAQYHINGDIAHAFTSYYDMTGDKAFLPCICEVLAETARLWIDTGHWLNGKFRIDCVTGPDEYTCLVNNNYYTNACAAANLAAAARLCAELDKEGGLDALKKKIGLRDEELSEFARTAKDMFFPYDESHRIIAQDDSFLSKKRLELSDIPKENFPLLMHYHAININRFQVLKQADSVLANYLYREETPLMMMRSYRYYEEITTHDSSLSNCIYAIMAARLGDMKGAWTYFENSVGTDTADLSGNTRDGLHIANMGGVYAVMTAGFGGVRYGSDGISLFPLLPDGLVSYSFSLCYKGSHIAVTVGSNSCTLKLCEGEDAELTVYGEKVRVGAEGVTVKRKAKAVIFDLDGVITNTASLHFRAWKKMADELGIDFDEKRNEQFKGVSRAACLKLLLGWGGKSVDQEEFDRLLVRKNDYYKAMLEDLTPSDILPGVQECLGALKEKHIPFAVFSVSKNTDKILEKIGLSDTFDIRVTGEDIEHSKPHYEGYLLAAERMGVDPRLCVMVEDSEAGISGARALSFMSLAIMRENKAGADVCIESTAQLPEAMESFFGF